MGYIPVFEHHLKYPKLRSIYELSTTMEDKRLPKIYDKLQGKNKTTKSYSAKAEGGKII
jgi:hypothetical protein